MSVQENLAPWVAVAVQGGLGLFFLGKAKGLLDAVTARVTAIGSKLDGLERFTSDSLSDRARLNTRVTALESNAAHGDALREAVAANVQTTREELAAFRGAAEEQHRSLCRSMESVQRELQGVNRQLANLAADRLGFPAPDADLQPARPPRTRRRGADQ